MSHPMFKPAAWPGRALRRFQAAGMACLAAASIVACGGDGGPATPAPARDGVAAEQTAITAPPTKACDAAQGADLPPLLNTQLDCAP